jgi:hypothetical protein
MKFRCQPVGLDFLEEAPRRFEVIASLNQPAEHVFAVLGDPEAWVEWFEDMQQVEWTSPEPHGVGSTRTVTLDIVTAYEYFIRWEQGRRLTFRFEQASAPAFRAFLEDYHLIERGERTCELHWTVCWSPSLLMRPIAPLLHRQLYENFKGAARDFETYINRS